MQELTYSQGLIIEDPTLLATLSIFCAKVWLPYAHYAHDLAHQSNLILERVPWEDWPPRAQELIEAVRSDPWVDKIINWDEQYSPFFKEGVLQRLTRRPHEHHEPTRFVGHLSEVFGKMYGGPETLGVYAGLGLHYHLARTDNPGIELFDAGSRKKSVDLVGSLFYLQLPKISADPEKVLDLRSVARKSGVAEFWEMIDEHVHYAETRAELNPARAEKIRKEFKKWTKDRWKFRGKSLYVGLLTTLAWFDSKFAPFASFAAADWIGEVNQWWAGRKQNEGKAFKFISRIDGRLKKLAGYG